MNRLRAGLRNLFTRKPTANRSLDLPPHVVAALAHRDAHSVHLWIQETMQERRAVPDLTPMLELAKGADWAPIDLTKLEALAYHYAGNSAQALHFAAPHISPETFDPDLFIVGVFSLYNLGQFDDAYRALSELGERREVFAGRADFALTAALVCWSASDYEGTRFHITNAWQRSPNDTIIAVNANAIYFELGDLESSERVRASLRHGHHTLERIGFSLAVVELAQDRYQEGFRLLEQRYAMPEAGRYINSGLFSHPRWQGEPLSGQTLLLTGEQGLGDTIQMARFLPMLQQSAVARIVLESQAETVTLLEYNFPDIPILVREYGNTPAVSFDLWTGLMSLPHLLGATADALPGRAGYLRVPPENRDYWRDRVSELASPKRPRIGLAWSGQPKHRADRRRSIPFDPIMDAIRPINATFFALQTYVPPGRPDNLIDISEEMVTLADTAALIDEMDLVITVDTSIVHLAGAIGKETWLLLPYRYEWRWGLEGERNNWYDSVRVLRQTGLGDWPGLLSEVFNQRLASRGWIKEVPQ